MKCSIVIRSYNEAAHIGKLIYGIQQQDLEPHEVILVDSGSTDETREIAERGGAKIIRISKSEFSFGRALNIGCEAATGDIVVFASAHVFPRHKSWLRNLVEPFEDQRVAVSYGRQLGDDVNKFSEHRIFQTWFPDQSVTPQKSYFCNNANCAVRRKDWRRRPYDEQLTGLEDLAWAKHAQQEGGWIAYRADAEIVHVHDESWAQVRNRYRREAIAMKQINETVTLSRADFFKLLTVNIVADLKVARRLGVLRKEFWPILFFRYNQFVGTYKGYRDPDDVSAELRARFYFPSAAIAEQPSRPEENSIDYKEAREYAGG
ncbi:MAG: glycosyltransferase family 2 protein [Pseudomonadota bacterium]